MALDRVDQQALAVLTAWLALNVATAAVLEIDASGDVARQWKLRQVAKRFEARILCFTAPDGATTAAWRYRLYKPRLRREGMTLPVVVFLHGAGERGTDNLRQVRSLPAYMASVEFQARHPCWIVAPQCPPEDAWNRESDLSNRIPPDPGQVVMRIIDDLLQEPGTDPKRVYLIGFSMGGYGAWNIGGRFADRFAAVLPVAGGGDVVQAADLAHLPIWAVHGADDPVIPPSESRNMIEAIRKAGGQPHYTELLEVGHESLLPGLTVSTEILDWLFEQSLGIADQVSSP